MNRAAQIESKEDNDEQFVLRATGAMNNLYLKPKGLVCTTRAITIFAWVRQLKNFYRKRQLMKKKELKEKAFGYVRLRMYYKSNHNIRVDETMKKKFYCKRQLMKKKELKK